MYRRRIFAIKLLHSAVFIIMVFSLFYILYCAIFRRYDWTLATALGFMALEGLSLAVNRFRCPLTTLAERWGSDHGAVTDIFLPGWLARNTFKIATVMVTIEVVWLAVGYFIW